MNDAGQKLLYEAVQDIFCLDNCIKQNKVEWEVT